MIDFHSHLIPAVDDGAGDLEQARDALMEMWDQGVRTVITTPHLAGALLARPGPLAEWHAAVEPAWESLREMAAAELPELRLERGSEVALDAPAPDVSDPRVRLAGTNFVLVEFPHMGVPPNSENAIFELRMKGWTPVIAHPERYSGVDPELRVVESWMRVGGALQVNCASLLGRYGASAERTAWKLLERGWASYLSSDYHARGRCAISEARETLIARGGGEQARMLMATNPERLLNDQPPLEVAPLTKKRAAWWKPWS